MMEAATNGSKDQNVDLGKPFFAVYKCDKPFKGTSIHDLYAGESVSMSLASSRRTIATAQDFRPSSIDASSLPEVRRPASVSPTSFKPHGVNAQASIQSIDSNVSLGSDIGDGLVTSQYARMMPGNVRVRTAVGGGVGGAISREGIRQMKIRNGSRLVAR